MLTEPFLDKSIIKEKTDNIIYDINKPIFEKIVLESDQNHEGCSNGYYTIMLVNNEYRLYYRAIELDAFKNKEKTEWCSTEECTPYECFCLAVSNDGLNFEKKKYNFNNNILKNDLFCHNFFPYYIESQNKYIGISGTGNYNNGLHLFESIDGINWIHIKMILDVSYLLDGWIHHNHFDTHNCIIFNKQDEYYYIYVRNNKHNRFVQYTKTKKFNTFTKCENIKILNNNDLVIYSPGIFEYKNTNYFLSFPTIHGSSNFDKVTKILLVSVDGINWEKINSDPLFDDSNRMIVNGMVESLDKKKLYIYTHENLYEKNNCIKCYSFEINRINKITSVDYGFIKTDLIKLINNIIYINFETFDNGYILVKIYNKNNELILNSSKISGNELNYFINWENNLDINEECYIKFDMYNSHLYSFSYS
jgi:hypothetical protein